MQAVSQNIVATRQFINEDGQEVDVRIIFSPAKSRFVYVMTRDSRFEGSPFTLKEMRAINELTTEILIQAYPDELHPSHVTRSSDSSSCDLVCTKCGAADHTPGGYGELRFPCPQA